MGTGDAIMDPRTGLLQAVELSSTVLLVAAVGLGSLIVSVALLTIGYSVRRAWRRQRLEAIRSDLREELLSRLYGGSEPAWEQWVLGLSSHERGELESVLAFYLRELDGSDAIRLAELGKALGIDDRSRRHIETGGYWHRLHVLTWLALLRDPPDRELLYAHCTDTPRERAAAARVLYLSHTDDLSTTGTDLLLGDDPRSFSVFGIDTLYRVSRADPSPLFERAAVGYDDWEPALQQQVLLATRHLNTVVGAADVSWISRSLSSPHERVRAEAYRTLGGYGWHRGLRSQFDMTAVIDDPSPIVRASTYRALGEWGDTAAIHGLYSAATVETDDRARVVAAATLYPYRNRVAGDIPEALGETWSWAAEHARFDAITRDISRSVDAYVDALSRGGDP